MGIPGYCLYETYGPFDVLMRVWLNVENKPAFEKWLQDSPYIGEYAPFHVESQYHWALQASPRNDDDIRQAVEQLDPSDVVGAQQRRKAALARVQQQGIAELSAVASSDRMKFFTCVVPSNLIDNDSVDYARRELIAAIHSDQSPVADGSVYTGVGFARLLVKGRLAQGDYYRFRDFVLRLSSQLAVFRLRLHTLFAVAWDAPECDDVADSSLAFSTIVDAEVASWIPELYHPDVLESLRNEVHGFIVAHGYCRDWEQGDRGTVRDLLVDRLFDDQERSVQLLAEWFIRTERELRESQGRLFGALGVSGDEEKEFREQVRGKEEAAIGTLFRLAVLALSAKAAEEQAAEFVAKAFNEHSKQVATLRNFIMHGNLERVFGDDSWMTWLILFSEFLPKFRRFRRLVADLIASAGLADG